MIHRFFQKVFRFILSILPLAFLAGVAAFFLIGPIIVEKSQNKIDGEPLLEVTDKARALHKTLTIVDLHSDSLMWSRNLLEYGSRGHVDVPRLHDGNVTLQVFSSVSRVPSGQNYDSNPADNFDQITPLVIAQMQPLKTWNSIAERSLYHSAKLDAVTEGSQGVLRKVTSVRELDFLLRARGDARRQKMLQPMGAMFSVEGLQNLEGKRENLDRLYDAGMRMGGLVHFYDNELAGSMHGEAKGGLTKFGREIVRAMEAKGIIVDIAHCSRKCVSEVLAMARRPVVSSHGGVQATCDVNRNLTDEEIRGVAHTGGVIGVGYWEGAVCSTSPKATAKAMKHIRDLVGIAHVALGSDFDGAVTVRFDTAQLVQLTQALLDEGFSEAEIRAAMGENALRVIRAGIQPR